MPLANKYKKNVRNDMIIKPSLNNSWDAILCDEFKKPYFNHLTSFICEEYQSHTVYPQSENIYHALKSTSFENVKVIILGQDPYHGKNQADGLCFSVNDGVKIPPSLKNIYKELYHDLGITIPNNGNLSNWTQQGVLLLNSTLTVREGQPGSHQKKGWEFFTDYIIHIISSQKKHCVFLLWGNFAKTKKELIDTENHLVLEAAHPSPLARGAFFGCKHFSKTNNYLIQNDQTPIDWSLPTNQLF